MNMSLFLLLVLTVYQYAGLLTKKRVGSAGDSSSMIG